MAAPLGNNNASKGKRWSHAIQRAIDAWPDKAVSLEMNKGLDNAAFEFVTKMMAEKDLGFFREFGDRTDGKPAQVIVGDADADPIQVEGRIKLVKPLGGNGE